MAIQSNYPDIRPSLNLDFANTKQLDPRITFTRASTATYYDGKTMAKAEENLLRNSATLATQNVAVIAQAYTLSFQNTGSVTLSGASTAGPLVGTGVSNRVSLTFTPTAGTLTLTVSGTVSNAQLEARSSATAYTPTTTQPITNYIPALQTALAGVPRFEHNPLTGESLGLEIEEQRANLLTYSEQFDNAAWTKVDSVVSANTAIAPDGTLTGDKLVESAALAQHACFFLSTASATAYTYSAYIKAAGRNWVFMRGRDSSATDRFAWFDLANGVLGTVQTNLTATIVSVGNGWYRCSITLTTAAATVPFMIGTSSGNGVNNFQGDGVSGLFIWGAQLEAGAFATSYIPTVASQVTRSADAASMTGTNFSSWYRQDEGTAYIEATTSAPNSTFISLCDFGATYTNRFTLSSDTSRRINIADVINNVGFGVANTTELRSQNVPFKVAGYHSASGNAVCLDASAVATASNTAVAAAATVLTIGARLDFGVPLNGTIRRLAYYPKRLTNAQLQAITS
jgi:hypothetical protein